MEAGGRERLVEAGGWERQREGCERKTVEMKRERRQSEGEGTA